MTEPTEPKLTVFISYVNEDSPITDALNNALQDAFGEQIAVFMDRVSIQQGDNIRDAIKANLSKADVLAIISTGTDRPSHDWAGFELGFFAATHLQAVSGRPLWGRVVTLCSFGATPRPQALEKYIPLEVDSDLLNRTEEDLNQLIKIRDEDPLMLWFGELFKAVTGEDLGQKTRVQDKYKRTIIDFKKRVLAEFRRRPKLSLRPQKQLTVRYRYHDIVDGRSWTPESISFEGGAASVFGLPDGIEKRLLWQRFAEMVGHHRLGVFWTMALLRALESARTAELVEMNRTLVSSHDESHLYRFVLSSCTTYYDDSAEARIYLIEVYNRPDSGDPDTSLLLKGLQLACRFRFLFLEPQSEFYYLNVQLASDKQKVSAIARRIAGELDLLTSDAIEAKIEQPGVFANFLGDEPIAAMISAWRPLREQLTAACAKAIAPEDEQAVAHAQTELAAVLKQIFDAIRPYNHVMLTGLATRLAELSDDHNERS